MGQSCEKSNSLTSSWTTGKITVNDDELKKDNIEFTKEKRLLEPPIDKMNIVFIIMVIHGLGTLMPWNMFITAKSYFVDFKLASSDGSDTASAYASNFMQYMGFAAQIPNVAFNWLNVFVNLGGDFTKRIVYCLLFALVIFIITVLLAILDSSGWQDAFFWITMVTVVLLNMANGIYQNTVYGMAAMLPIKYTGAAILGANVSGLFASVVDICSTYIFTSHRTSAIYYFITAMLILMICFDTYFGLPLNKFYRYYITLKNNNDKQLTNGQDAVRVPYWTVAKAAAPQLFNAFFTFFVTLSLFPAIHSDIYALSDNFFIPKNMFTAVTCFLTFNLFAMLGSLTTSWIKWPQPKYLSFLVIPRVIFLPLFIFCNYLPIGIHRALPVLITNEWVYWIIAIIMSYTSGYCSSLAMMYAPQTVLPQYQSTAGMFAAAFMITGIFSGILFSFILPSVITL